jgi:predicted N-acetyltransferase YhbS
MPSSESSKPLDERVLRRLTNQAILAFLGEAERFEATAGPGLCLALCNEPVADMNMLVIGEGADVQTFEAAARPCLDRSQPFLTFFFPDAPDAISERAPQLGLVFAVDFPFMVHDGGPLEPGGREGIEVVRGSGSADAEASAHVLGSAFSMPVDAVLRALPASLMHNPAVDVFVAREGADPVGTVTLTYHGDTCGVWAMGTDTSRQRGGIGRRLLSTAMAEARRAGAKRFFLGATPAGYRLYEGLGYSTRTSVQVWASGQTHQA